MRYNISKSKAPEMPNLGKGTECIKILLSQASEDMFEPMVPMFFPVLGAHISGTEFQYPDNSWKETCGMMANLVANSGDNKGQFPNLVEAICRKFREHDEAEVNKLVEWAKEPKEKGKNKEKARPDAAIYFPPTDTTNPAFILNAMALEAQGGHTQYFNMPEVEMADQLCGCHKKLSQLLRNVYDRARAGALRATKEGVTGNPIMRANLTFSSTPGATRKFYKYELFNGTFGRMVFSYKPRASSHSGRIPRQGLYSDEFYQKLDEYLERLDLCKGRYIIRPLNRLIDRLAQDMATLADLTDDDLLFELSHRSLVSAWKAGCILWILNNQSWTKAMSELVEWLVYHDLWSKMQIFADMLKDGDVSIQETSKAGPKNMLDSLPNTFNEAQLEALRQESGKSKEGTKNQLYQWLHRKFIEYSNQTGLYSKTEAYLKGNS